jgi:hypothetical protein
VAGIIPFNNSLICINSKYGSVCVEWKKLTQCRRWLGMRGQKNKPDLNFQFLVRCAVILCVPDEVVVLIHFKIRESNYI